MSWMFFIVAILLTLGGAGGLFQAVLRLRGGNPPLPLAYMHGSAAGLGVVALVITTFLYPEKLLVTAIIAVVLGVPLGVLMLLAHRRQELIPISLLAPHGLLEIAAIVLTWIVAISKLS